MKQTPENIVVAIDAYTAALSLSVKNDVLKNVDQDRLRRIQTFNWVLKSLGVRVDYVSDPVDGGGFWYWLIGSYDTEKTRRRFVVSTWKGSPRIQEVMEQVTIEL